MRNWTHGITVAHLTAAILTGCGPVSHAEPVSTNATVLRAVDGDTLDVSSDSRGRLRIRVVGLDTPETVRRGWSVGCHGPEASSYAKTTLTGQRIALVIDPTQDATDRYGRTLAGVLLSDGRNYAVEAVRRGHGRAYLYGNKPNMWAKDIAAAEDQARQEGEGLWGAPCYGKTESEKLDK